MKFIVVQDSNGEVLRYGEVPDGDTTAFNAQAGVGQTVYDNSAGYDFTYYYTGGSFVARPDLDTVNTLTGAGTWVADGTTLVTYGSSLPSPTAIRVTATTAPVLPFNGTVTDGTLSLTADYPDTYVVTLSAFPYLDKTLELTAS